MCVLGAYCMKLDGVSLKHEHSSLLRHKALSDCGPLLLMLISRSGSAHPLKHTHMRTCTHTNTHA